MSKYLYRKTDANVYNYDISNKILNEVSLNAGHQIQILRIWHYPQRQQYQQYAMLKTGHQVLWTVNDTTSLLK